MESNDISFSLEQRKYKVNEAMKVNKSITFEMLEELGKLDNTNKDVLFSILQTNKNNKELLFTSFDILEKKQLQELEITKELSNKQSYFYFLKYMNHVKIIDDILVDDKVKEKVGDEVKITEIQNEEKIKEEPQYLIDFLFGKISFEKNRHKKKEIENTPCSIENNEERNKSFEKCIQKKNINIQKTFVLGEKIKISELRKKLSDYQDILIYLDTIRNNFPDLQTELFYHYQLKNVISSFLELENDEDFIDKKNLIQKLCIIINKVEENKIKDSLILTYFYFIIDMEYKLDPFIIKALNNYNEVTYKYSNANYDPMTNKLIINENNKEAKIIINNFDLYEFTQEGIDLFLKGEISEPFPENLFSLRGYLLLRDSSKKDSNIFYEKFLPSKLVKDIIFYLYEIKNDIFGSPEVVKTFKENTFCFPITNDSYLSYTDKENFKIFIDSKVDIEGKFNEIKQKKIIIKFIRKSVLTINMEHEFGHGHRAFLFYLDTSNDFYDSPLIKFTLDNNDIVEIDEGGEILEYLLYDREISEMNFKEIIYINNFKNFSKDLKQYRNDFQNLQKKTLDEVFIQENEGDNDIKDIYKIYKSMSKSEQKTLEAITFKSGKRKKKSLFNLENIKFSLPKKKPHNKNKRHKKISKFNV